MPKILILFFIITTIPVNTYAESEGDRLNQKIVKLIDIIEADYGLYVCNENNVEIQFAYAYKAGFFRPWKVGGWHLLEPNKCKHVITGDLSGVRTYLREEYSGSRDLVKYKSQYNLYRELRDKYGDKAKYPKHGGASAYFCIHHTKSFSGYSEESNIVKKDLACKESEFRRMRFNYKIETDNTQIRVRL